MRLDEIMTEVASVVSTMTGLTTVYAYPPDSLVPPAGYVSFPTINFDQTYGRGEDEIRDLPIVLVVGKVTDRSAVAQVARWSSGDGAESLKARLEAYRWTTCDDLTVTTCEFDIERIAGVNYLAATFRATIAGEGADR